MNERVIGQLSFKGPQTLEGLDRREGQIGFAISRLEVVLNEIGITDLPSYLRGVEGDNTRHPFLEKLNAHNFDSLPALEKRDRFLQTAGIITNIAEVILPALKEQQSDLAEKKARAEQMVEETEEVKKLKKILSDLEGLKSSGVRIEDETIGKVSKDLDLLRRNTTIRFHDPTQPPDDLRTNQKPPESDAEKKQEDIKSWSIPGTLERKSAGFSPRREIFDPKVSDTNLGILNKIINDPEVSVESVLADLGTGLSKPVNSKEAVSVLKEAVNYLFLKVKEGKASDLEIEILSSIQILSGKDDPAKDLREFQALLEQWFEEPKKPQPVQGIIPETIEPPARPILRQSHTSIDAGPFPKETSLKLVTIESAALAQNLLRIMPYSQHSDQALALAIFVTDLQQGKIKPITNADLMQTANSQKILVAQNAIRQRLAGLILRNPQPPLENYKYQWARDAKEIIQFLGAGGNENFAQAIDDLPEFERAMVIAISSLSLLEDLGYLDLDECNEESFVSYIRNASFTRNQSERDDSFTLLIDALIERGDMGTINHYHVVDGLLELDYADSIFDSLIESARLLSFQDNLIEIFSAHPQTAPIAKRIQRELDSGEEESLPRRRIII